MATARRDRPTPQAIRTVPAPVESVGELPVGLSFMARAWEEPKLLGFGYAFEQATQARHAPRFLEGYGVEDFALIR